MSLAKDFVARMGPGAFAFAVLASSSLAQVEEQSLVESGRTQFRSLLASNPNYFGNVPGSPWKAVNVLVSSTNYEELTRLGYNPDRKQLSASFDIKQSSGYRGGLCTDGSYEYVRFYVDLGSGWTDVGLSGAVVNDTPPCTDCAGKNCLPLSYSAEVDFEPAEPWCTSPQLPRARAILSWELEPPPNQPDWKPVYGNVMECHIQIDKSFWLGPLVAELAVLDLPAELSKSIYSVMAPTSSLALADGVDLGAALQHDLLSVSELGNAYRNPASGELSVEPHRFAFSSFQQALAFPSGGMAMSSLTASLADLGLEIGDLIESLDATSGNTSYEELEDVALNRHQDKLVATFRTKKETGFSGSFCTAGSTEYVAFWADWEDDCTWDYLGTVEVNAYDFSPMPSEGLCYTAVLPIDFSQIRKTCGEPVVGRVRAVLSWNTPPSTVDPNAVPHWGNRVDAHVLVPHGESWELGPVITAIGGIGVEYIDDTTGLTTADAKFVDNGLAADSSGRPCPFGGRVVIRGPGFPPYRYQVNVREVGTSVWTTLTKRLYVTAAATGVGSYHEIDADGWFRYLDHDDNFAGILGDFDTSGDSQWEIELKVEALPGSTVKKVRLDNTLPSVSVAITSPAGDCSLFSPGVLLGGHVSAYDSYLRNWSVGIDGGPASFGSVPTTTGSSGTTNTPFGGSPWTFDTTGLLQCGYVVRAAARDRAIRNSVGGSGHYADADVGFCVLEP